MNPLNYAYGVLASVLTGLIAAMAKFDGAKIGLTTDDGPYPLGTQLTDVHEATYDGYARSSAVTWGTVHTDNDGTVRSVTVSKEFKPTGSVGSCVVKQAILVDAAGTGLLASYVLPEPIPFHTPDDVYQVCFELVLDSNTSGLVQNVNP